MSGVPQGVFPIQFMSNLDNRMENVLYVSAIGMMLKKTADILRNSTRQTGHDELEKRTVKCDEIQ